MRQVIQFCLLATGAYLSLCLLAGMVGMTGAGVCEGTWPRIGYPAKYFCYGFEWLFRGLE